MTAPGEWNGEERRKESLAGVQQDLASVRDALFAVAEGMTQITPRHEIETLVDKERKERRRLAVIGVTVGAFMMLFVGIQASEQRQLRNVADGNKATIEFLEDCTLPGGKCYGDAQKRQAELVDQILDQINCVLLINPEARTRQNVEDCQTIGVPDPEGGNP